MGRTDNVIRFGQVKIGERVKNVWTLITGTVTEITWMKCECYPHGPYEPCTCTGCGVCDGRVYGCTCDINWDCTMTDPCSARMVPGLWVVFEESDGRPWSAPVVHCEKVR